MQHPDQVSAFPRIWPEISAVYAQTQPPEAKALREAFEGITGWELSYWPTQSRMFAVTDLATLHEAPRVEREAAERLASAFSAFCRALWQQIGRERSSLDSVIHDNESGKEVTFVSRCRTEAVLQLENTMEFAAEYVGGSKSTLWLLDEQARYLNYVAGVGLSESESHKTDPRLLVAAPAEITAMAGQAVVALDPSEAEELDCPFGCESAVCLPVSTSESILGAVWFDGGARVDWEDRELELLEMMAGRMALELGKPRK